MARGHVQLACDDLGVILGEGTSLLVGQVVDLGSLVYQSTKYVLYLDVHRMFMVARSHYSTVDLQAMG